MNLPTKITLVRIILIPVFAALFLIDVPSFPYLRFMACGVFIIASLTDFLDGYLARKYNLVTDLGKFLDPIADKMLVTCALIGIILDQHMFTVYVTVCAMVILCRELAISGFRIIAAGKKVVLAADKLGKIKTALQMVALIILIPYANIAAICGIPKIVPDLFLYIGFSILALSTIMALVSGINYLVKNKAVLSQNQ